MTSPYDIAIIGGGISGFATALRLQNKGYRTLVLEAHGQLGGCAGFFTKKGFSFDVGATTLVDFNKDGVGEKFLTEVGLELPRGEYIDYEAWLPDRNITLYQDKAKWHKERLAKLGASENHQKFWQLMDEVTDVFWNASRKGIKLPIQSLQDVFLNINAIGLKNIHLARYLPYTFTDILKKFNLQNDIPLKGFLSMLIEDTVHSGLAEAPFINAALGTTIRGAGLMRADGGMKKFWEDMSAKYADIGGTVKKGNKVTHIGKEGNVWTLTTHKSVYQTSKIISSLLLDLTCQIAPDAIKSRLAPYIQQNQPYHGSAIVVFLGVPEREVADQKLTCHQLLHSYQDALGNGNNMFISVSGHADKISAPAGFRSVVISTHCSIDDWQNLSPTDYEMKKYETGNQLISYARKVYPELASNPVVFEVGTPLTYQKYTHRINGSVGGFKQTIHNSNFKSVPQFIGLNDFWLVGDNTWPGLGTVAAIMASKIVAEGIIKKG